MWLQAAVALLLCAGLARATVRSTDKDATLMCIKDASNDFIEMYFRVKLDSDPQGDLRAISNSGFNNAIPSYVPVACTTDYSSAVKVYTVVSVVSPDGLQDSNSCGMTEKTDPVTGETIYQWLLMHNINVAGDHDLMMDDKDRVYIAECRMSTAQSNIVTSSLVATNPNLNVQVSPANVPVVLRVYRRDGTTNNFLEVSGPVTAGTDLRFTLTYTRNSPYNSVYNIYGIYGFSFEAGSTTSFTENDMLIGTNGCTVGVTPTTLPFEMTDSFNGAVSGNDYVLTSGTIPSWKYASSSEVYFQVYFGICFEPDTSKCTDLCFANTGTGRKKRQTDDVEYGKATAVITISTGDGNDAEHTTAEESNSMTTMVALACVLGVLVLLVLVVMATTAVVYRKTRDEKKHRRFDNMSTSSSSLPSKR